MGEQVERVEMLGRHREGLHRPHGPGGQSVGRVLGDLDVEADHDVGAAFVPPPPTPTTLITAR